MTSSAVPTAQAGDPDDDIKPVYPNDGRKPDPLAERFCKVVHELPDQRKASCCPESPSGVTLVAECIRTLSYALGERAVTLTAPDVDACEREMKNATEGCDWFVSLASPLPAACDGIIRGALAQGARCRSSLECADGLRCQGLSTTTAGACDRPRPSGTLCNVAVDTLAAHTRQDGFEAVHPECEGYCAQRRCAATVAVGDSCRSTIECGKNRCVAGKCSASPLPKVGDACSEGGCAGGAKCLKGKCTATKREGEACESDAECRGACVAAQKGAPGKCEKRCPVLKIGR
jgi:hypothetical protein